MMIAIPDVLDAAMLGKVRAAIEAGEWVDGNATAGHQAALAKRNRQLTEDGDASRTARALVVAALEKSPTFIAAALPLKVVPPLFNRYEAGMAFDAHVDGAVRAMPWGGPRMRADVSSTLFLTDPEDYDGGELLIEHAYGTSSVKLAAGAMIVDPVEAARRVDDHRAGGDLGVFLDSVDAQGRRATRAALRSRHGDH